MTLKKIKRILIALFHLSDLNWWVKNWQRIVSRFFLAILALIFLFRYVPIPFSSYMAQQKISHLLQGDFRYQIQYDWVNLDHI